MISLYARGMTTREIQGHLEKLYGTEVSPTLISTVTDAVLDEVTQWQNRPLRSIYPIVYLDALFVKVRHEGRVVKKAVYLALGLNLDGEKELLGLWIAQSEGAKFWLGVLTELKNRGVSDVFICCVDGLSGFEEAIEAVYPQTVVQLCIVHMVRNSLRIVTWKDRKAVAMDLKAIYRAATVEEAELELGRDLPDDQSLVATALGSHHAVFVLPGGDPEGDLHDQRHRVAQPFAAKGVEDAGGLAQ